jgi:hypothetical protein
MPLPMFREQCLGGERVMNQAGQREVELRGGVVHLRWANGGEVTAGDVRAVLAEVTALCKGRRRPLLADMQWMEGMGFKARDIFAGPWPVTRVAVVVASPVDQVILNFYLARHRPACPTRYFTSAIEAMTWLKTPAVPQKKTGAGKKLSTPDGGQTHR